MIFKVTTAKDRGLDNILKGLSMFENEPVVAAPSKKEKPPKDKKVKKGKKKKKKDDDIELLTSEDRKSIPVEECEDKDIAKMMGLLDVDSIMNGDSSDDDDGISEPIIRAQRGSYRKRKKDSNEIKKEFAEELTLLYDLLGTTSDVSKKIRDYINFDNKKIGGINKSMSDMVSNLLSAQGTQLQILKEISSVKKNAIDLTLKAESKKDKEAGNENMQHQMSALLNTIMKQNRGEFTQATRGPVGYLPQDTLEYDDEADGTIEDFASMLDRGPGYTIDERDEMADLIAERLREEGGYRSEEGDAYIRYEAVNAEVKVKLCVDTGEWEFFAVDQDGNELLDYPLPKKRDVEPLRFTGKIAIDKRSCQYKVVEYYSADLHG